MKKEILAIILVLIFSGCALKSIDENFKQILLENNASAEFNVNEKWWQDYNQPNLNELINLGLKNNTDLAKSAIAINKALAQAGVLEAELIPSFNANFSASSGRDIKTSQSWQKSYSSGFLVSYEVDLWRKMANSYKAALWEANATKFDLEATRLSVINNIVDGYFNILYLNEAIKFYEKELKNYKELEKITLAKFLNGKEEELSLKQLQSSVLSMQNRIINEQNNLLEIKKTLRVLLNEKPDFKLNLDDKILSEVSLLGVNLDVPLFAISNRPDLQAAIARINESLLNVNVAQKAFYPSISIGASLKGSDNQINDAFSLRLLDGNIALNLPFLNYSKLKSNLRVSEASFEQIKLNYISTLNSALNELDKAYKQLLTDQDLLKNYNEQASNLAAITQIYELKYQHGKSELKNLLEANNNEIEAKINLLNAKYKLLRDETQIYQALAGKFESKK